MIYLLTPFVIQSEAKNLGNTMASVNVDVHEIFRFAQQHVFLPSVVWMTNSVKKYIVTFFYCVSVKAWKEIETAPFTLLHWGTKS